MIAKPGTKLEVTVGEWPTPLHLRKAADALDKIAVARYGDVIRAVVDAIERFESEPDPVGLKRHGRDQHVSELTLIRTCAVWAVGARWPRRAVDWLRYGHARHECVRPREFAREHEGDHMCSCGKGYQKQATDND